MPRETKEQKLIKRLKRFKNINSANSKIKDIATEIKVPQKVVKEKIKEMFTASTSNNDLFGADEPVVPMPKANKKAKVKVPNGEGSIKKKPIKKKAPVKRTKEEKAIEKNTKNVQDFIKDAEAREERRQEFNNKGLTRQGVCPKCVDIIDMHVSGLSMNTTASQMINDIEKNNEHLSEKDISKLISQKVKEENMYDAHVRGVCPKCNISVTYTEFVNWDKGPEDEQTK
jgi:hypothetical protein